jgi:hypothetical protein
MNISSSDTLAASSRVELISQVLKRLLNKKLSMTPCSYNIVAGGCDMQQYFPLLPKMPVHLH